MSDAGRSSTVNVASGDSTVIGIIGHGPVKKNTRAPMVELTNRSPSGLTFTVSLADCTQGLLYNNNGDSGCSVSVFLFSGGTQVFDIDPAIAGTINYSISVAGSGFSLQASESVLSETGNVSGAVLVQHPTKDQDFTANLAANLFELARVDIRDGDDDDDLAEVKFEVRETGGGGSVIASKTISDPPVDRYSPKGNPAEVVEPDQGYTITPGILYQLTTTGTDADGNFASQTVETTA